jgi:hypothetical protein
MDEVLRDYRRAWPRARLMVGGRIFLAGDLFRQHAARADRNLHCFKVCA